MLGMQNRKDEVSGLLRLAASGDDEYLGEQHGQFPTGGTWEQEDGSGDQRKPHGKGASLRLN